jgi:phenylalanine-4-hydroxylase
VNKKLAAGPTGFQMVPVAGLVTSRAFLGNLRFDQFLSTSTSATTRCPVHARAGHRA